MDCLITLLLLLFTFVFWPKIECTNRNCCVCVVRRGEQRREERGRRYGEGRGKGGRKKKSVERTEREEEEGKREEGGWMRLCDYCA